ncbi:Transcription initiation factor TFIID subunit 2 [Emydomyces testavorans]|uniref:Transcription initiation factor TFIID subunit 2 n=1 Tax=Emydomyces testavorans TaxID=2070801 RepID=A0AAF0IJ77_9EURO|nr:Transcription initiation factor TFIID subunit 2 [Emydomyces testavorans]
MPVAVDIPSPAGPCLGYSVAHQKVELDIDLGNRTLTGKTEITIHPHHKDLKVVCLNFRQGELKHLSVNGRAATVKYVDPYKFLRLYGVNQYRKLSSRVDNLLLDSPEPEIVVTIPRSVRIEELDPFSFEAQTRTLLRAGDGADAPIDIQNGKLQDTLPPRFTAITVNAEFFIDRPRDGVQFVGVESCDQHYPHVFTTTSAITGEGCCVFPCVQDLLSRCTWDISIRCARTLGAAIHQKCRSGGPETVQHAVSLNFEDESMDMVVICSGDMTDEITDVTDPMKKIVSFFCGTPVSAQQIGFAIGPFEYVNLTQFRESDEDDQLGHNAVPVHAFCLPGRADEVRNTGFPLAKATDFISLSYGAYPFSSYKLCFVDNAARDTLPYAALAVCSNRLLFPDNILGPLYDSTRYLVHALASQWIGINVIPKELTDNWIIVGVAYYITDTFMKKLCGNNEFRYRLKQASDKVCDLDIARPSIWTMGTLLKLDASEMEFLSLKAPLVLYILERRLSKASGKATVSRIISRIFLNARMGDIPNSALTTVFFQKLCERFGHFKLDQFFQQWVYGAGCPRFVATQRFNKKKLVVEIVIRQVQSDQLESRDLDKRTFIRDAKEELQNVYAGAVQHVFTGPMTIRIHEADGTPYEHIVEIKEAVTKFDIPYNTKYKRLKRNRRQKERVAAISGADTIMEGPEDVLLYCLGDVLQSEEEMQKWRLVEWTKEDEDRMGQESYEWIRMDADFEWICKMSLTMPGYMYLSQLQQDRDVVAQLESIQYMAAQREHPLISTIFVRTLMDRRYFHGIRSAAAWALVKHAKEEVDWVGLFHLETAFQELFCLPNSSMTRSNDFSDRATYSLQVAIPQAIAKVRDSCGKAPMRVQRFLYEKLKFNDNSNNEYSDCYYVAALMRSVTDALVSGKEQYNNELDFDINRELERQAENQLRLDCIAEIHRYKRMDEWMTSFQNLYARTAIDCQVRLMKARVLDFDIAQFLPYTRLGTFDLLRLDAFQILLDLDKFQQSELLRWFIYTMSADPSPWMRRELHRAFGKSLASVAFGKENDLIETAFSDNLVIDQEFSADYRRAKFARVQTISGALDAIKKELADNMAFKEALWAACNSPCIGLTELNNFLYICKIVYEPIDQMLITLQYPRYWKVEHLGSGKMWFTRSSQYRTSLTRNIKLDTVYFNNQVCDKRKQDDGSATLKGHKIMLKVPKLALLSSTSDLHSPSPTALPKLKLKIKAPH